jgi:hypothetical protein
MSLPSNIEQRYVHKFEGRKSSYFERMLRIVIWKIHMAPPSHNSQHNTEIVIIASWGHLVEKLSCSDKHGHWKNWHWLLPPLDPRISSRYSRDPGLTHEQRRLSTSLIIDSNNTVTPSPTWQPRCCSAAWGRLTVKLGVPLVKVFLSSEGGSCAEPPSQLTT